MKNYNTERYGNIARSRRLSAILPFVMVLYNILFIFHSVECYNSIVIPIFLLYFSECWYSIIILI